MLELNDNQKKAIGIALVGNLGLMYVLTKELKMGNAVSFGTIIAINLIAVGVVNYSKSK